LEKGLLVSIGHWSVTGQGFAGAVLGAVLTLWSMNLQQSRQEQHAEHVRFIDGAQTTAQETTVLLFEGFNSLKKLANSANDKGWKEIRNSSWHEYYEFHQHWRERLITEHFKLIRYFGKHMADQLIHVDEIDLHPLKDLKSTTLCSIPGGDDAIDIEKLASHAECIVRMSAVSSDIYDEETADKKDTGQQIEKFQSQRTYSDREFELLKEYEKAMIRYIRTMDEMITQLGAPQVTVISSKH
jgi:hypothetical protein